MKSAAANALLSGRLQTARLLVYPKCPTHWPGSLILTNMAKILILSPKGLSSWQVSPPPLPLSRDNRSMKQLSESPPLRVGWKRLESHLAGWRPESRFLWLAGVLFSCPSAEEETRGFERQVVGKL